MSLDPICVERTNVSMIKFEEGRSKAVFRNPTNIWHIKVKIDGCLITNTRAADAALYNVNGDAIIIELKGIDVAYGASQVATAAEYLSRSASPPVNCAGLVVGKQYPKFNTAVQRIQSAFAKRYKRPLHIVTKNGEFDFDAVQSFDGPHRI